MEDPSFFFYITIVNNSLTLSLQSTEVIVSLIILLILLLFSGLISASEIAFFSTSQNQKIDLKTDKSPAGKRIQKLMNEPNRLLSGILIINNLVNISIILISTYIIQFLDLYNQNQILTLLIQIFLITILILLFGEIIPKIYAGRKTTTIIYLMEKFLTFNCFIFKPLIFLMVKSNNSIDKRIEKRKKGQISMNELSDAVDLTHNSNDDIGDDDQKILKGITTFKDKEVKDIMTSRPDIVGIDISTEFQDVINIINEEGYSRIPVYKENLDNIEGMLYIKDLLPFLNNKQNYNWNTLIREAYFVPESKKINALFQEFKLKKIHIAIVVDEYGGTTGLISLEDVIEEIFGEIGDEFDNVESEIKFTNPKENEWIFEAKTSINDGCKLINENENFFEDIRGDADSLGGLFLEINQHFPKINDKIIYKYYSLTVVSKTDRKIDKIKINKK